MEAIVERVAGVDVGQATVVATVLVGAAHERAQEGDPHVPHRHAGPGRPARLAGGPRRDPCRDGEHRGLLEAGLRCPGGTLRADRRQRPPHQGGAGPQDGREGRRSGSPIWSGTGWCAPKASCRRRRSASCATWRCGWRRSLVEGLTTERNRNAQAARDGQHQARQRRQRRYSASPAWLMLRALVENAATPEQMAELARGKLRSQARAAGAGARGAPGRSTTAAWPSAPAADGPGRSRPTSPPSTRGSPRRRSSRSGRNGLAAPADPGR